MKVQIIGKLIAIKDKEVISDKFTKQSIWVEIADGKYPQTLNIEFSNNSIDEISKIKEGDDLQIEAYLKGRKWQDKCFNSISGSAIKIIGVADETNMVKQGNMSTWQDNYKKDDDLPF